MEMEYFNQKIKTEKQVIYLFHAAYDSQTLRSQQHASPHHSSS